jgi:hypothetical protein
MNFCLYLFFAIVAAQHGELVLDCEPTERFKATEKSYTILYVGCGAIMLWLILDLWVIMSDQKKVDLPYYLEPTDQLKNEEKARKEKEKIMIK